MAGWSDANRVGRRSQNILRARWTTKLETSRRSLQRTTLLSSFLWVDYTAQRFVSIGTATTKSVLLLVCVEIGEIGCGDGGEGLSDRTCSSSRCACSLERCDISFFSSFFFFAFFLLDPVNESQSPIVTVG